MLYKEVEKLFFLPYNITSNNYKITTKVEENEFMGAEAYQILTDKETLATPKKRKTGRHKKVREIPENLLYSPVFDDEMMKKYMLILSQNIEDERIKQGIPIAELAEMSNVTYAHLTQVLNGSCNIGLNALIKLMLALKLNPEQVFPFEMTGQRSNGDRYNELTKGLDAATNNFILGMVADYSKFYNSQLK